MNFVQDVSIRHLTNLNLRTLALLGTEDYLSTSRIPMLKFSENGENQNFDIGNLAAKGLRTHWMHLIFHVTLTIKRGPLLSSGSSLDILAHILPLQSWELGIIARTSGESHSEAVMSPHAGHLDAVHRLFVQLKRRTAVFSIPGEVKTS